MHPNLIHAGFNIPVFKNLINNRKLILWNCLLLVKNTDNFLLGIKSIKARNTTLSASQIRNTRETGFWNTLIILEDCLKNYKSWNSLVEIFDLFFNGRHSDMSLLLLSQEIKCLVPSVSFSACIKAWLRLGLIHHLSNLNPRLEEILNFYSCFKRSIRVI